MRNKRVYNLNRYLIVVLLSMGFVTDEITITAGITMGDAFFLLASIIWLWLPECNKLEQRFFTSHSKDV